MSLIPEEHKEHLRATLAQTLVNPVKIVMFTQTLECKFCPETQQLIQELAALNEKISVEVFDFVADAEKAKQLNIDKVPALTIMGEKDYGVRFYGLPYGYEFQTLIEAITIVSNAKTNLTEETKQKLREIITPVHIQVFVTLTCPYCPLIGSLAHKFALENDLIRAEVVDASEFPQLAVKYGILGVPKTVINEKTEFIGVAPENVFLEHVMRALQ